MSETVKELDQMTHFDLKQVVNLKSLVLSYTQEQHLTASPYAGLSLI